MPFLFKMTFGGVCAFVPAVASASGSIVLVDARTRHPLYKPHSPELTFFKGGHYCKWELDEEDVVIDTDNTSKALSLVSNLRFRDATGKPINRLPNRSVAEERDVSWIASMESIVPTAGTINPDCFTGNGLSVARFKLLDGVLSIAEIEQDEEGDLLWSFETIPEGTGDPQVSLYQQAVASEISLTILAAKVTIAATKFGGAETRSLTFDSSDALGGEVNVSVNNLCDTIDQPSRPSKGDPVREGLELDFGWFFKLCKNYAGPVFFPRRGQGRGFTGTYCTVASFEASPGA